MKETKGLQVPLLDISGSAGEAPRGGMQQTRQKNMGLAHVCPQEAMLKKREEWNVPMSIIIW